MSSVASANPSSGTAIAPGVLFRASAVASAVAVALVVVSAVLELGATHWGIALVALPLLVAQRRARATRVSVARAANGRRARRVPRRDRPGGRRGVERRCRVVDGSPRGSRGDSVRRGLGRRRRSLPRRGDAARLRPRLPHADEAADHDAAAPHRCRGDVRRRAGRSAARTVRRDDARARACVRRRVGSQPRARPRHRRAHGQPHGRASGRVRSRHARAGARVRDPALGGLVRAPRIGRERPHRGARARRATSSTSSSTPAGSSARLRRTS